MAKITFDILDDNFFQQSGYQYQLTLLIAEKSCSYLLQNSNGWLAYRSYEFDSSDSSNVVLKDELETLMHQDKMLNLTFESVQVRWMNQQFTFVPNELYETQQKPAYLANVVSDSEKDILKEDVFLNTKFKNIYVLNTDIQQFLDKKFPNCTIQHSISSLLDVASSHAELTEGKKLYLNFNQKQMQVLYFDEGQFVFANNFDFQTAKDVTYYTMLVVNQFGLDPEDVKVFLSGHIDKSSELYNAIYLYIRNVNLLDSAVTHAENSPFNAYSSSMFISMI